MLRINIQKIMNVQKIRIPAIGKEFRSKYSETNVPQDRESTFYTR